MLQVVGYVLIRETGAGIANLVVTAFDCGRAPESLRRQSTAAEVLQNVGTRISSVLTDADGRFVLSSEDLAFQGNEARPDLVVAVFAPEDIVDPDRPYPDPPERRVLYMSLLPRMDAGAREAFIIRLARSVVGRFLTNADVAPVFTAFDQTWRTRDAIADGLNARHLQELERRSDARGEAAKRTANLNAVPMALRNHPFLVTSKAALSAMVEKDGDKVTLLESLQTDSMRLGLRKLKDAKKTNRLRLYCTKDDLKELGVPLKNGKLSRDKTTLKRLNAVVLRLNGGTDLVLKKTAAMPTPEQLELKYLKAPAASRKAPAAGPPAAHAANGNEAKADKSKGNMAKDSRKRARK